MDVARRKFMGAAVSAAAVVGATGFGYTTLGTVPPPFPKEECPECVDLGWRHKTWVQPYATVTAMSYSHSGYWDEDGIWFPPCDPNITTRHYKCSNGHSWQKDFRHACNQKEASE